MMRLLAWMALVGVLWTFAVIVNRRAVRRENGAGDPRDGVLLFVEPVRWLFVIWGFGPFCRGVRRSGWKGQIRLVRWSSGAGSLLVFPDVVRQKRLSKRADKLARLIERVAADYPESPIHLVGYSSGCYIVVEALRRLERVRATTACLLAATISPTYSLDVARRNVDRLQHVYSPLDLINLLGPLVTGTNDRQWTPACGSVGFRLSSSSIVQRRWRWTDVGSFYLGDHFSIVSPRFVCKHFASWLTCETPLNLLQETPHEPGYIAARVGA